ncbi:MAG: hypothetical protein H6702_11645 [Myxococcales bacterium]|nr:hypothetical protein [Myxococcales bacterium]
MARPHSTTTTLILAALFSTGCIPPGGGGGSGGGGGVDADAVGSGGAGAEDAAPSGPGGDAGAAGGAGGAGMGGAGMGGAGAGGPPGGGPFVCGEDVSFLGQNYRDAPPNGGNAVFEPYRASFDTGLAAAMAQARQADAATPIDVRITGVVVTATMPDRPVDSPRSQTRFWVADGVANGEVALPPDLTEGVADFPIRAGQRISFTATQVQRFHGQPQISGATGWALEVDEADVYITEPTDPLRFESDLARIVRLTGTLRGDGAPCGGDSRCWTLEMEPGWSETLRSASDRLARGDCVTFVGPVSAFGGTAQLDTFNYDWIHIERPD